jgi:hypothetical protein
VQALGRGSGKVENPEVARLLIFSRRRVCGSGVGCADAYRTAEAQQSAQPMDGPARRLATHMMAEFFAQPIRGDGPKLRLVVDNGDRSKTAP